MSKERDLLNKAIEMIQIVPMMASIGNVPPDFGSELILEIQELLAQPEPLTPRQGLEEYKKGYARAELDLKREPLGEEESYHEAKRLYEAEDGLWYEDGFVDGLKFAEKMHGIGGGE